MTNRRTSILKKSFIPIIKQMEKWSFQIIITHNNTTYDVTNYVLPGATINRIATVGLSSFAFNLDNNGGRYKDIFSGGDSVDIYYNYVVKSSLSVRRFRGYIDNTFDSFDLSNGYTLIIEGRDAPKSTTNDHFGDTHITKSFIARNNLDCWFGTIGTQDSNSNYPDSILYNSGLILRVYDVSDGTWKNYKDLTTTQKNTLKAQTGYTKTHTNTYIDTSRLTISKELATEGDYEFRIYYDGTYSYLMVHPEDAIFNTNEHVTGGQNLISLGRYGKDTTTEFNRVKVSGFTDSNLLRMRTKENIERQSVMWIKDKEENASTLTTDADISARANARLTELKEAIKKGTLECCALPTLQPGEQIPLNLPYILNDNIKIKSFSIDLYNYSFNLNLKERETTFEKLFKDRIDENVAVTPNDNPNGLQNWKVYDFSDTTGFTFTDCEVTNEVLKLKTGQTEGMCIFPTITADKNVTKSEVRINANQYWNCEYYISNDAGVTYEKFTLGALKEFFNTLDKDVKLKIILKESSSGVSVEFSKISIGFSS